MHQRYVEKLYGMRARMLSLYCVHACPRCARGAARDGLAALGVLGGSAAKWTNVVWPIKSRQTNQQTNTHYSFIGIDRCSSGSPQSTGRLMHSLIIMNEGCACYACMCTAVTIPAAVISGLTFRVHLLYARRLTCR